VLRRVALVVLAAALAAPAAAAAPEPEVLFEQFGLFGAWAVNCARPVSPANPSVMIAQIAPGVILEEHDLGGDHALNRYSILSAEKLSDTELGVDVLFQPGTEDQERQRLVFAVRNKTRRTMFNRPEGGAVRVKDGAVVGHGSKTPLLHKCD
jgi:hypothetical protein